jgi:hypothetical protein
MWQWNPFFMVTHNEGNMGVMKFFCASILTNATNASRWPCHVNFDNPITYISEPKKEALHLSIESFILGSLNSFNFFVQRAN